MRMLQWQAEVDAFTDFITKQHINDILEIGTGPGGFIEHLGTLTTGALVSVDLPDSGDQTGLSLRYCLARNRELQRQHPRFVGILGDSHSKDTFDRVALSLADDRVDLLFLDGDDTFEGKCQDYLDYSEFVRPGAWIATHDIVSFGCGVPQFWGRLSGEKYQFIDEPGHPWGGIGVVKWLG